MPVAYAPRSGVDVEQLGVVAVGDNTINLAEALEEGDGVIVVADDDLVAQVRLDELDFLKHVPVPQPKEPEPQQQATGKSAPAPDKSKEA